MGFWKKLFAKKSAPWVEHEGQAVENVPLYPRGGHQVERDELLPDDKRRKWVWVNLSTRVQAKGALAGQTIVVVSAGGRVVGELPPKYRDKYPEVFEAVIRGVNVGTVCLSAGGTDAGNTTADLTIGEHKYQPRRPHEEVS